MTCNAFNKKNIIHNEHVKSQDGNCKHHILDIDRHKKMNLASSDAIAVMA